MWDVIIWVGADSKNLCCNRLGQLIFGPLLSWEGWPRAWLIFILAYPALPSFNLLGFDLFLVWEPSGMAEIYFGFLIFFFFGPLVHGFMIKIFPLVLPEQDSQTEDLANLDQGCFNRKDMLASYSVA